jgi:hypothetical protein
MLIEIPRPFVVVVGCIPPDLLNDLSDERGREDGFIHRILFSYPDPTPLQWVEEGIDLTTREEYFQVVEQLAKLPMPIIPGDDGGAVSFTPEAREQFAEFATANYAEMDKGPPHLRGPWSKLTSYCARLALIVHLTREACGETDSREVDELSVLAAEVLIDYFKSHARKVYRRLKADPLEKTLSAAVDWIKKRPGNEASARDVYSNNVAGCRSSEDARSLFCCLEKAGWGQVEENRPPNGGRATIVFKLDCRAIAGPLQGRPMTKK